MTLLHHTEGPSPQPGKRVLMPYSTGCVCVSLSGCTRHLQPAVLAACELHAHDRVLPSFC